MKTLEQEKTVKIKSNKIDFYKTKYGKNLLIDLIHLESLKKYINTDSSHYLSYFDITLITGGEGQFFLDGEKYGLKKGLVIFSLPGQIRKWNFDKIPTGYVLIFEKAFLASFFSDPNFIDGLSYFNRDLKNYSLWLDETSIIHIVDIFKKVESEIKHFKNNDEHILRALLYQVLIWLNRKFNTSELPLNQIETNRHIRKFVDLVNKKYKNEHSVSYYADKLNISTGHLNDLSKLVLGISAKKYISEIIIVQAKKLLVLSDSLVSEIALELGFIDTSYFIRQFKLETGKTPLSFRKEQNL